MKEEGERISEIGAACVNDVVGEVEELHCSRDEGKIPRQRVAWMVRTMRTSVKISTIISYILSM